MKWGFTDLFRSNALAVDRRVLFAVLDKLDEAVFVKDKNGSYVFVNVAFANVFQKSVKDIIEKSDGELFPKTVASSIGENDKKAIEAGRPLVFREDVAYADQTIHVWKTTKWPFLDKEMHVIGIMGIAQDITKELEQDRTAEGLMRQRETEVEELDRVAKMLVRRDLELSQVRVKQEEQIVELERVARILVRRDSELTQAKERLEKMNKEKSEFLSIVAHQLRTPLTGIKWPLSVLGRAGQKHLTKKEKLLITEALGSTERMIALVNDFLNVVRIDEGRLAYIFKPNELVSFVERVKTMIKEQISEKSVTLRVDIGKAVPTKLTFDEEKLTMVLQNLLDNAVKFSPLKGTVTLSVKRDKNGIIFSVADSGIGIPKEEHEKIFRKFSMASNAIMYEGGKGTGLGLYLAKNIIEAHGGTIWFESEEGHGTTFYFTLPLSK